MGQLTPVSPILPLSGRGCRGWEREGGGKRENEGQGGGRREKRGRDKGDNRGERMRGGEKGEGEGRERGEGEGRTRPPCISPSFQGDHFQIRLEEQTFKLR